jgi:hypothetical protein
MDLVKKCVIQSECFFVQLVMMISNKITTGRSYREVLLGCSYRDADKHSNYSTSVTYMTDYIIQMLNCSL